MGFNLSPEGLEASATVKTQRLITVSGANTGAHASPGDIVAGVSQDWTRATDTTNNDHAQSGEPIGLQESLRVRVQAGDAITAGKRVRADEDGTGRIIVAALAEDAIGICLNTIAAADELAEVWFHPNLGGLISLWSIASASEANGVLDHADFTDGTAAIGSIDTGINLAIGDVVLGSRLVVSEDFAGDASAIADLGDGSTADLYTPNSPSVFAAGTVYDYDSAPVVASAAVDVTLSVTVGADWGDVTGGKVKINMIVLRMEP